MNNHYFQTAMTLREYLNIYYNGTLKFSEGDGTYNSPRLINNNTIIIPDLYEAYVILFVLKDIRSFFELAIVHSLLTKGYYDDASNLIKQINDRIEKTISGNKRISSMLLTFLMAEIIYHELGHLVIKGDQYNYFTSYVLNYFKKLTEQLNNIVADHIDMAKEVSIEAYNRIKDTYNVDYYRVLFEEVKKTEVIEEIMADDHAIENLCKEISQLQLTPEKEYTLAWKIYFTNMSCMQSLLFLNNILNDSSLFLKMEKNGFEFDYNSVNRFVREFWIEHCLHVYYKKRYNHKYFVEYKVLTRREYWCLAEELKTYCLEYNYFKYFKLLHSKNNMPNMYDSEKCKENINTIVTKIRHLVTI